MEDKFVEINAKEFSDKLEIVFNKILSFSSRFRAPFELESYRNLSDKIKQLFPVVIEVTKEFDGNLKLDSDFYDFISELSTDLHQIQLNEHIKIIYENVNNIVNRDNKILRNEIRQYQNQYNFNVKIKEITDAAEQVDGYLRKIQDVVKQAETLYTEHALKGFKTLYNGISESQKTFSKKWLIGAFIFGGLLLISISCCFLINSKIWNLIDYTNETNYIFIFANEISFNLVLLAAFFWCARMYSINKALEINYRHKSASSDALLSFVEAIKNDDKTKNSILLEAARMIFAPPETGLTSKGDKLNMKLLDTIRDISPVNNDNSKK